MILERAPFVKNRSAAAAVEFALVAPLLILTTVVAIQLSVSMFAKHQLTDGVDRAVRLLQINPDTTSQELRDAIVFRYNFDADKVEIVKEVVTLTNGATAIKLTVRAQVDHIFSLLNLNVVSLSAESYVTPKA